MGTNSDAARMGHAEQSTMAKRTPMMDRRRPVVATWVQRFGKAQMMGNPSETTYGKASMVTVPA